MLATRCARRITSAGLLVGLAAVLAAASPASAQTITSLTATKLAGNSANQDTADIDVFSATQTVTAIQTRYSAITLSDVLVGNTTATLNADYQVSFTVTAPGDYTVTANTSMVGAFSCIDDTPIVPFSGNADIGPVTGTVTTGPAIASGSLNLADPGIRTTAGSAAFPTVTNTAAIHGTSGGSGVNHVFRFQFTMSANSSADECAAKIGIGSSQAGQAVGGAPGIAATDGHFVNLVLTSYCGNGVLDSARGEQCDPSIGGTQCCTSACRFASSGTACDDALFCNGADTCNAGGSCVNHTGDPCVGPDGDTNCSESCNEAADNCTAPDPDGSSCRPDAGECDVAETCLGGTCPADAFEPSGTACGSPSDTVCDNPDTCNGSGACQVNNEPVTTECRADTGDCDVAENCDGAGSCPADAFEPSGTACGNPSDTVCDNPDSCDGSNNCQVNNEPASTECRGDTGDCDVAENCDGAGSCPADAFEPSGTACGDPSDTVCDNPDTCDGSNNCQVNNEPASTECRADAGECDVAENCDGAGSCPADAVEPSGTACGSPSDTDCDNPDTCDGAGSCEINNEPSSTVCRAAAGLCDVDENCDGAGSCPADQFEPNTTLCRADTGDCDVPEFCLGGGTGAADCPVDLFESAGTACGDPSDTVCDNPDTCDGSNTCLANPEPGTTECRAAAGVCDVAESCDGAGSCPADAFEPATTVCRPDAGDCDVPDFCLGGGTNAADCPADAFEPAATACGSPVDTDCNNPDSCNGSGTCLANNEPSGTACGNSTNDDCTDPDTCNGAGACQSNNAPNGTPCDDSNECTTPDACTGGICVPGSSTQCLDHYKCYKSKDLKIPAKFVKQTVTLVDQFGTDAGVKVIKPAYVCNPVDKAGSGINNPVDHLTCYKIKGNKPEQNVQITNQLGTLKLKAIKSKLLCVPGTKTVVP